MEDEFRYLLRVKCHTHMDDGTCILSNLKIQTRAYAKLKAFASELSENLLYTVKEYS